MFDPASNVPCISCSVIPHLKYLACQTGYLPFTMGQGMGTISHLMGGYLLGSIMQAGV